MRIISTIQYMIYESPYQSFSFLQHSISHCSLKTGRTSAGHSKSLSTGCNVSQPITIKPHCNHCVILFLFSSKQSSCTYPSNNENWATKLRYCHFCREHECCELFFLLPLKGPPQVSWIWPGDTVVHVSFHSSADFTHPDLQVRGRKYGVTWQM